MSTPTREYLLSRLPTEVAAGFYIESDDGQPDTPHVYCPNHAWEVAKRWGAQRGIEAWRTGAWAGSDRLERCAIKTCDVALFCGGLTDHGVDEALALTETDPFEACVSPEEILFAAWAMSKNDPRWAVWDRQILRVLEELRR